MRLTSLVSGPDNGVEIVMSSVASFQALAIRYTLSALAIVSGSVILTLYASGQFGLAKSGSPATEIERDYKLNPFELTDAVQSCQKKTRVQFEARLLRTNPDWHSSRYDPTRKIFLVALHADVGSLQLYETAYIYCYVNPDDYRISYYRVEGLKSRSFFSINKIKRFLESQN